MMSQADREAQRENDEKIIIDNYGHEVRRPTEEDEKAIASLYNLNGWKAFVNYVRWEKYMLGKYALAATSLEEIHKYNGMGDMANILVNKVTNSYTSMVEKLDKPNTNDNEL